VKRGWSARINVDFFVIAHYRRKDLIIVAATLGVVPLQAAE
jgi:hypothetical protein